jgi:hypothetical protein
MTGFSVAAIGAMLAASLWAGNTIEKSGDGAPIASTGLNKAGPAPRPGGRLTAADAAGTAAAVIGTAGRNVADAINAFNG